MMSLDDIRIQIDKLDNEILSRINQRAALAQEVAKIKQTLENSPEFYRPEREAKVLKKIMANNQGPLANKEIAVLFREIMSACLALEQPINVAYLGPEGTFTQAAALKHFGKFAKTYPFNSIAKVFREVEIGDSQYGVVPIENSTEGVITHTLDEFVQSKLKICGEVEVLIHHNLLSQDNDLSSIKEVYAHQQSLGQCRQWLDDNLPNAKRIPVSSNAEAAKTIKELPQAAAIASEVAADIYDLNIVAKNIEDIENNTTRFLIIGRNEPDTSGEDKTTLLLVADNKPGALHRLLEPFSKHGVSMSRIESRPSRRMNWEYVFFVDVNGHQNDEGLKQAIETLRENSQIVSILGSYPKSIKY